MPKHKKRKLKKYAKKAKRYAKKAKHYVDNGVKLWNKINTPANKKKMASMGKRASRMQENILNMI